MRDNSIEALSSHGVHQDETLDQIIDTRANVYGFLARLLRSKVDPAFLIAMRSVDFASKVEDPEVNEGYQLINRYLAQCNERSVVELSRDYDHLFSGALSRNDKQICLYEAMQVAVDEDDAIDMREDIEALMHEEGFALGAGWAGTCDHASIELEIMQVLSRRAAEAARANDIDEVNRLMVRQLDFFTTHIANWLPALAHRMTGRAGTDFYKGVGCLMHGSLELDRAFLSQWRPDDTVESMSA